MTSALGGPRVRGRPTPGPHPPASNPRKGALAPAPCRGGAAWLRAIGSACALSCDLRKDLTHRAFNAAFDGVSVRHLIEGIAQAMGRPARLHPMPFAQLPDGASPYGPDPRRSAGYVLDLARRYLGFEPSALEDALAETLAWYRVARPSHPGYANRAKELALAGSA